MDSLTNLNFIDFDSQLNFPIPSWANFYLSLGFHLVREPVVENRKVVVLSVPTRSFCSALIVTGAILYMAQDFDEADLSTEEGYFRHLLSLPDGTRLLLRNPITRNITHKGQKVSSIYGNPEGCIGFGFHVSPKDRLRFPDQFPEGRATQIDWLPSKSCWDQVELDATAPTDKRFVEMDDGTGFRSYIFEDDRAEKFYKNTSATECLIIGEVKLLESEIQSEQLIIPSVSKSGGFQDIIRVDTLDKLNLGYKTKLLTDRINTDQVSSNTPKLTVFDNPRAFLKWNTSFTKSNTVVILDRTDPNFDNSVLSANQEFENRQKDLDPTDLLRDQIPYGVEIMSYYARVI